MLLNDRIISFVKLGKRLADLTSSDLEALYGNARNENSWFVEDSVRLALEGIQTYLNEEDLRQWLANYDFSGVQSKNIGLITAGNIPLVGFHDVFCVLLSGHQLMLKVSSKDQVLMRFVLDQLFEIAPTMKGQVTFIDRLNDAEAFIATGSDNSARYFEYYFKDKPHVIRKNRSSLAVLTGKESKEDFNQLGKDIFQYYGLGCRNVSKVLVPEGYDFIPMLDGLADYAQIIDHHKYRNNYDYNKSIYLVNKEAHLDTDFLLVRQSDETVSPISVLYYQEYKNASELADIIQADADKLQCIVGKGENQIPFGQAQKPRVWEYADGVDTMQFLVEV